MQSSRTYPVSTFVIPAGENCTRRRRYRESSTFFARLREVGMQVEEHPFPDHYRFTAQDLVFNDDKPVVMTEKDAVKCQQFAMPHHWYLPVTAQLENGFAARLLQLLKRKIHG